MRVHRLDDICVLLYRSILFTNAFFRQPVSIPGRSTRCFFGRLVDTPAIRRQKKGRNRRSRLSAEPARIITLFNAASQSFLSSHLSTKLPPLHLTGFPLRGSARAAFGKAQLAITNHGSRFNGRFTSACLWICNCLNHPRRCRHGFFSRVSAFSGNRAHICNRTCNLLRRIPNERGLVFSLSRVQSFLTRT